MQIDTWNTPPLPQRAAPQPWEDIASVISRTARKMGYGDPKWILQPELIPHRVDPQALPLLRQYEDYQMLELLLALEKEAILSLTLHRFAPRFESQVALDPPQKHRTGPPEDRYLFLDYLLPFSSIK